MKRIFSTKTLRASPSVLRSYDTQTLLRLSEEEAEWASALIRVLILAALAALLVGMEEVHDHTDLGLASLGLYGMLTLISVTLAWRHISWSWLPYALVTFDIGLIGLHLTEMTRDLGVPAWALFGIPASGLLLLILVHVTMRFRPALVLYAGGLIIFFALTLPWFALLTAELEYPIAVRAGTPIPQSLIYWLGMPLGVVLVVTAVLWLLARKLARLLNAAIAQAGHAIRLSRFFSPNLVDELSSDRRRSDLRGHSCMAAVLFIDIRGFTAMSENLAPQEIVNLLTEFRTIAAREIFTHNGTVDKFIGDAVMAVFGTPETHEDDAARALQCGVSILKAIHGEPGRVTWPDGSPLRVAIGGHYGEVFAGAIGSASLLEYTVLGDTVNVAERLQKLCGEMHGQFAASNSLFCGQDSADRFSGWHLVPNVSLPGRHREISVYMLPESASPADTRRPTHIAR